MDEYKGYPCADWCAEIRPNPRACVCTIVHTQERSSHVLLERLTRAQAEANMESWRNPANIVAQGAIP